MRTLIFVLVPFVLSAGILCGLPANNNSSQAERPADKIRALLSDPYEEPKLQGLRQLDDLLSSKSDQISQNEALSILTTVLTLGGRTDYEQPQSISLSSVRIRAVQVLSRLNGPGSQQLVIHVLVDDPDDKVVEEALRTARVVFDTTSDQLAEAIGKVLRDAYPGGPHDSLMLVAMDTIQFFHDRDRSMNKGPIFNGVLFVSQGQSYLQVVRNKALKLIRTLIGATN